MRRVRSWALGRWLSLAYSRRAVLCIDGLALVLSVYLGYALRLTLFLDTSYIDDVLLAALLFTATVGASLWAGGLYRVIWPQASVEEYVRLARYYCFGVVGFAILDKVLINFVVPRTTLGIMVLTGLLFLGGIRVSWRLCRNEAGADVPERKAFIVGAGEAGSMLARDLLRHGGDIVPVGFLDDDPKKRGMEIAGVPVLGTLGEIGGLIGNHGVEVVLIALPSASGSVIRTVLKDVAESGVEVRVLPSLRELADGRVEMSRLRKVRVEDVLCREPIQLDLGGIGDIIRGKAILVTGAGGSIGSEICRQVVAHQPSRLVVVGHGEYSIYRILEEFGRAELMAPVPVIADVADALAMERLFAREKPHAVFHAAAHKHVPLMEENPREALRVNALGTMTVARCAGRFGAERMVLVSTDKAVNPTSIMGATKRVAERLVREVQEAFPETAYMAVRFGNVLGSRGSVVPKFEEQIAAGGPVTVTDPEMRRYFMLIPEAVSLVLQAAALGKGGELFVLDMGEPVKIFDLAEMLIRLHGYRPHVDIPIEVTGMRPGEKLFEELFYDPARVQRTSHDKIYLSRLGDAEMGLAERIVGAVQTGDDEVRELLRELVAFYEEEQTEVLNA